MRANFFDKDDFSVPKDIHPATQRAVWYQHRLLQSTSL